MELSRFIADCAEQILDEWEAVVRTQMPVASEMSSLALRDHLQQLLEGVARRMESGRDAALQLAGSKPSRPDTGEADSAACSHGELRQLGGFSLDQLLAEYRALRAMALRVWLRQAGSVGEAAADEMVRFNEAMDHAVAMSACTFSEKTSRARDLFLAMLGHDLRGPLSTMAASGDLLSMSAVGTEQTGQIGARVKRSAATMTEMVNDLQEYSRSQLGRDLRLEARRADLKLVCETALQDAQAGHPECRFEMEVTGDLHGEFDSVRLQQVFTNLLRNAAQYGSGARPVTLRAHGANDTLTVQVGNHGPVISPASLDSMFDPLVQLPQEELQRAQASTSLGLGLFIARQITEAHGGKISAESSADAGTVFTVRIPRRQAGTGAE